MANGLGLRYPKVHEIGNQTYTSLGQKLPDRRSFPSSGGDAHKYLGHSQGLAFHVNPKRYSEVRKVVFYYAGCLIGGTNAGGQDVRLRVAFTNDSDAVDPSTAEIAPGSTVVVSSSAAGVFPSAPNVEAELLSKRGDAELLQKQSTFTSARKSSLWKIEFDRFEASSAEFFNAWDELAASNGDDEYCQINLILEMDDGTDDWTTNSMRDFFTLFDTGMSIVQAPTQNNRTTTFFSGNAWISYGAEATSYANPRCYPLIWDEDEWDGVTAIHVWSLLPSVSGTSPWEMDMRVFDMDHDGGSFFKNARYTETISETIAASDDAIHRSQNILSSIQSGDNLSVEWKKNTGSAQGQPTFMFEIIQEDFNKTVCIHPAGTTGPISAGQTANGTNYYYGKGYFDPQWYANFPDSLILASNVWAGGSHVQSADDLIFQISISADEQAEPGGAFELGVNPRLSMRNVALGFRILDDEITANNPLNLAGDFSLYVKYTASQSNDDTPGGHYLAYELNVPNREFLDLGPLFDVGAFNPEGCASTSAGLGEPPLLIITNGSVPPKKFNPTAADTDGEIEDAGIPIPFPEETPSTQVDDAADSPDGGLGLGFYGYRYTFRNCCTGKESDPSDQITVDTSGASPAAQVTLSFSGVRIPADPQICEICIYRTVLSSTESGLSEVVLAKVGCFDVDEASSFVDTVDDDVLDFTNDGISFLNAPMPCTPIVVSFRNRLFAMGDVPNLAPAGTVSVTSGSDIITGDGSVEWDRCLEGKFIQVGSDCRNYEIDKVLPPEAGTSPAIARLQLTEEYEGSTDAGLSYTLCGRPNRLYISEPLEPECWPAANFLDVEPGDGDRLMGAESNYDRLVICKRRKTYVLTFREQPAAEVIVPSRISSDIGCIAPRSFAQAEVGTIWLSDRGLARFDGRSVSHVPESSAMNDMLIDPDNPNYLRRDRNGRVIESVGVFYPKREQYLLLLPTVKTERGCNMMLVWDIKLQNITLLEFCQEFLAMEVGKDADGNERVYLGDTNGFVWIFDIGDTDGVGYPNATGTVKGTIKEAGVTDGGVSFLTSEKGGFLVGGLPSLADLSGVAGLTPSFDGDELGLAGVCVYVRRADADLDDPWTVRTVFASDDDTLYVSPSWGAEEPVAGWEFMLGPIRLDLLFKPQNYGTDDMPKRNWRQVVVHEPEDFASELRVELLPDFQLSDPEELTVVDQKTQETGKGRIYRMDYARGRQTRPVGRNIYSYEAVRFRNFAPEAPIRILNHILMVTPKTSR